MSIECNIIAFFSMDEELNAIIEEDVNCSIVSFSATLTLNSYSNICHQKNTIIIESYRELCLIRAILASKLRVSDVVLNPRGQLRCHME